MGDPEKFHETLELAIYVVITIILIHLIISIYIEDVEVWLNNIAWSNPQAYRMLCYMICKFGLPQEISEDCDGSAIWTTDIPFNRIIVSDTSQDCVRAEFPLKFFHGFSDNVEIPPDSYTDMLKLIYKLSQKISYNTSNRNFIIRDDSWYKILSISTVLTRLTQGYYSTSPADQSEIKRYTQKIIQNPTRYEKKLEEYQTQQSNS